MTGQNRAELPTKAEFREASQTPARILAFVGTYTHGRSRGIYAGRLDPATGRLEMDRAAIDAENPSFLAVDPRRPCLYAVHEVGEFAGRPTGAVSAFSFDADTGQATLLNRQSSGGTGPCHFGLDPAGRFLLVANYAGGSVALLPVREDGSLGEPTDVVAHQGVGPDPARQDRPHAHSITPDPAGRFALAADLGLDTIFVYVLDTARGKLAAHEPPGVALRPGAGPRHLAFHPDGCYAYVINELDSTVTALAYDGEQGRLRALQTVSTLPAEFAGANFPADIHMHPSGRFLYGSNRGHDSLAVFEVEVETGRLMPRGHTATGGKNPRNFALDPSGRFLLAANQDTDTVVTFAIDADTGALTPTGDVAPVPTPACVQLVGVWGGNS